MNRRTNNAKSSNEILAITGLVLFYARRKKQNIMVDPQWVIDDIRFNLTCRREDELRKDAYGY